MKSRLFLIAGLILCLLLGFVIGRLWPSPTPEIERSGLNVRVMTGFNEDGRSFELSEKAIVTAEHILWYDWKSNIFALDMVLLGEDALSEALWWDEGYRLVVTVDDVTVHGIRYAALAYVQADVPFGQELTIFPSRTLFLCDANRLGGYDGSVARVYSIEGLGFRGALNTRIYYELARKGRLLEQSNSRYVLTEFYVEVDEVAESRFSLNSMSIVTFTPIAARIYNHAPKYVEIVDAATGEQIVEFTHFFTMPISFVMDVGEYEIRVNGGELVRYTYSVSGIAIPEL